jgi:hypothetical protein
MSGRRIEIHEESAEGCIWGPVKHVKPGNHGKLSTQLISSEHLERDCFVLANFLLSTEH